MESTLAGKTLHLGNESESNRIEEIDSTLAELVALIFFPFLSHSTLPCSLNRSRNRQFRSLSFQNFRISTELWLSSARSFMREKISDFRGSRPVRNLKLAVDRFECTLFFVLCRPVREGEVNCRIIRGNVRPVFQTQ